MTYALSYDSRVGFVCDIINASQDKKYDTNLPQLFQTTCLYLIQFFIPLKYLLEKLSNLQLSNLSYENLTSILVVSAHIYQI